MDPRKLLYFATIIDQGSLAKAARLLEVSQPALSKSMDRLEAELGMKLLERGPSGIAPTPAGDLVYTHARLMRDEIGLAQARLKGDPGDAGVVTVGTLPSLASSVLPLAVERWRKDNPGVLLRVVEKVQVELLLALLRAELDFLIGQTEFFNIHLDGLKQRVLFRDRLCAFARADHPLFQQPELDWADLARYPWVCPMVGWPQRTVLEKLMASEGVELSRQMIECGSMDFTKTLVGASDHLALLPAHCVTPVSQGPTLRPLPIAVSALKRDIAVVFRERQPLSPASHDLITHIQAMGTTLSST
jgi:DNA-binding transcriptional LysR family regulator